MFVAMNPLDPWGESLRGHNRLRVPLPDDVPPFLQAQTFDLSRWPSETRQQGPSGHQSTIWDPRTPSLPTPGPVDDLPLSLFGNDLTGPNFLFDPPLSAARGQVPDRNEAEEQDARQRAKVQEKNSKRPGCLVPTAS